MKFDKAESSGLLVLFIGVGLLAFTFVNAYLLLSADVGIVATQDVIAAFGKAIAPLIATVIHVMYLGIMGWIGSLLTLRGISLLARAKTMVAQPTPTPEQPVTTQVAEPQPPAKPEAKPKEEPKKGEKPETGITIEVRPPQETKETPLKPAQPQQPKRQTQE
jgi:outer membrane biosynthesis protein TonB